MLIPVAREAFLPFLVVSFLCGLFFGAVYDIFRIRRIAFRPSRQEKQGRLLRFFGRHLSRIDTVIIVWEDILFFLLVAVTMILVSFRLSYGIPRWYAFGAALGGFFLWRVTLGRCVMHLAERILYGISWVMHLIKRLLLTPLARCFGALWRRIKRRAEAARRRALTEREEKRILAFVISDPSFGGEETSDVP